MSTDNNRGRKSRGGDPLPPPSSIPPVTKSDAVKHAADEEAQLLDPATFNDLLSGADFPIAPEPGIESLSDLQKELDRAAERQEARQQEFEWTAKLNQAELDRLNAERDAWIAAAETARLVGKAMQLLLLDNREPETEKPLDLEKEGYTKALVFNGKEIGKLGERHGNGYYFVYSGARSVSWIGDGAFPGATYQDGSPVPGMMEQKESA